MKLWGLALGAAMAIAPAAAYADDDPQQWTTLSGTVKLSDRLRAQEELTFRFSDKRQGLYEIESNTLIGYVLTNPDGKGPRVTLWAGYTHDPQYTADDFQVMEHRAREQLTIDNFAHALGGSLSGRLRFEQRWREGMDGTGHRFRPYIRFSRPFHEGGKTALVLSHESFIDFNTTGFQTKNGYERMRNLVAISTPLDKHVTAEFGYLNQLNFPVTGEQEDDHVLNVQLSVNF